MEFIVSVVLSLTFGFFWLWWFERQDIYDKEPKRFLGLIFILSMPLSVLAGLLEYTLDQGSGQLSEKSGFVVASLFYLGVVAVIEELFKFFVIFTVAYPNRFFNEPVDGIVYAAAGALGFASFENAFYVLDRGPLILLLRGPFSTLGHVLFSALWGAALGLALQETERSRRIRLVVGGLVLSILAHGGYNIFISLGHPFFGPGLEWLSLSGILFLMVLYFFVASRIRHALHISSFNPRNQARAAIELLRADRQHQPDQAQPLPVAVAGRRYAPNPNRYQFRGQSSLVYPESSLQQETTRDCANCGQANLTGPSHQDCYNCGQPFGPVDLNPDHSEEN